MALSKPRRLMVNGKLYHWKASNHGRLHYAVFDTVTKRRMAVWLDAGQAITPAMVKKSIEESQESDWK